MWCRKVGAYCTDCHSTVTIRRPRHCCHFLLSVLTGGLWLIGWVWTCVRHGGGWRCTRCGSSEIRKEGQFNPLPGAVCLLLAVAVIGWFLNQTRGIDLGFGRLGRSVARAVRARTPVAVSPDTSMGVNGLSAEAGEAEGPPVQTEPVTATPPTEPDPGNEVAPQPSPPPEPPPDWDEMLNHWVEVYRAEFKPPALGGRAEIRLRNGKRMTGILKELSDKELGLALSSGARIRFPCTELSQGCQEKYFAEPYAQRLARQKVMDEKAAYMARGGT